MANHFEPIFDFDKEKNALTNLIILSNERKIMEEKLGLEKLEEVDMSHVVVPKLIKTEIWGDECIIDFDVLEQMKRQEAERIKELTEGYKAIAIVSSEIKQKPLHEIITRINLSKEEDEDNVYTNLNRLLGAHLITEEGYISLSSEVLIAHWENLPVVCVKINPEDIDTHHYISGWKNPESLISVHGHVTSDSTLFDMYSVLRFSFNKDPFKNPLKTSELWDYGNKKPLPIL